ncbi:hypothetical protein KQI33_06935 [Enterococcus devriesei]|uniref:hypothetical protein n=1 Tax=Enterococcus devriesei TaxID=319970 RepID=UPI001C1039D0|nr:hypothetical protein [Enterococcus devriesei]MBU5365104.1 hypothetical protein [Enterococcus devriesei]
MELKDTSANTYQAKQRQLEAQEQELLRCKKLGLTIFEQADQRLKKVLSEFAIDNGPLNQARQLFRQDAELFQLDTMRYWRQLLKEMYVLEQEYYKEQRSLTTEEIDG